MKKLLIFGLLSLGGIYGKRVYSMAKNLDFDFIPHPPQFKGLTLKIIVDILIKNPTNGELRLKIPNVKLFLKSRSGELIQVGHSDPMQRIVKIRQNSILKIERFAINVPLMNMAAAAGDIWAYIQGKVSNLPMVAEVRTTVYPARIPIPIKTKVEFEISKNAG